MANAESRKLVSVLVAVYNEEKHLKEAIVSVINQTYPFIEIIIVDNGSTDNTYRLACDMAKAHLQIKAFRLSEKGKNKAFNLAYQKAKGEYFTYVSGDDILPPESIERRLDRCIGAKDFATCLYRTFSSDPKMDGIQYPKNPELPNFTAGSLLFPRTLADMVFPIPEDLPNEDSWTSLHLRAFGRNKHVPQVLYNYRLHGKNSFGYGDDFSKKREKYLSRMEGFIRFYEKYKHLDNPFIHDYLAGFVEGVRWAKENKKLKILTSGRIIIGDKLRLLMYSSPILYFIRNRFFKLFSGVINT